MAQRKRSSRVNSATNRYLDQVIEQLALPSDYALAEVLGLSTQAIYKMRGGGMMGAATAAKVAHLLKLDALQVIAETELERGSDDSFWRNVRDAAAIAGAVIGAALLYRALASGFDITGISSNALAILALPIGNLTSIHIVALAAIAALAIGAAVRYASRSQRFALFKIAG